MIRRALAGLALALIAALFVYSAVTTAEAVRAVRLVEQQVSTR